MYNFLFRPTYLSSPSFWLILAIVGGVSLVALPALLILSIRGMGRGKTGRVLAVFGLTGVVILMMLLGLAGAVVLLILLYLRVAW
jgi:hypothetical protein